MTITDYLFFGLIFLFILFAVMKSPTIDRRGSEFNKRKDKWFSLIFFSKKIHSHKNTIWGELWENYIYY